MTQWILNAKMGELTLIIFCRKIGTYQFQYHISPTRNRKLIYACWAKLGIGKYVIHKNDAYWGFSAGANVNYEDFDDETGARTSWEAFIGTELNLFDIGDLSLFTKATGVSKLNGIRTYSCRFYI